MGCKSWSLTARLCDSCKAAPAAAFCQADSAFLCPSCDAEIHGAAAARHARVPVCDVCERAPAAVTCKADAAALCVACDGDIHYANPLARRHERLAVVPFFDAVSAAKSSSVSATAEEFSEEEAEAASWLLPDPNNKFGCGSGSPEHKPVEYLFGETDPYLDLDLLPVNKKSNYHGDDNDKEKQFSSDGVVPDQGRNEYGSGHYPSLVVDGFPAYGVDYPGSKPLIMYNFTSQSISQSVSSSSLDAGVVPDHNSIADIVSKNETDIPTRVYGADREARVLRYKEKRKNRKFEKTIRYASRKAYAETRPRVKGRFAKSSEHEDGPLLIAAAAAVDTSYGLVPTF